MRHRSAFVLGCLVAVVGACVEAQGLADRGVAEGRVLLDRFNTWVQQGEGAVGEPAPASGDAVRVNETRFAGDAPATGPRSGAAPDRPDDRLARERFAAAYAVLACAQAATRDPVLRERRRTELFRVLGYTNFSWLDDLERFGTADGDALKALCLP